MNNMLTAYGYRAWRGDSAHMSGAMPGEVCLFGYDVLRRRGGSFLSMFTLQISFLTFAEAVKLLRSEK